ncbi:unnamed protein product [Lathyrus sativus]|nr:unnamed protein product [Lathyrus sativus]
MKEMRIKEMIFQVVDGDNGRNEVADGENRRNDLPKSPIGECGRTTHGKSDVFESSKLQMEKVIRCVIAQCVPRPIQRLLFIWEEKKGISREIPILPGHRRRGLL